MSELLSAHMKQICSQGPVIPVMVIEDAAHAVPLARALVAGGLRVLEVTLRTPAAWQAIHRIMDEVPEATVGVGSISTSGQIIEAAGMGCAFGVSPGATEALVATAEAAGLPFLFGASSASEVLGLRERGWTMLKFFPAEPAGGRALLGALHGPLPDVSFCPTGGITARSAADYLALPNVICVGGSWMLPRPLIAERRWDDITALAALCRA